MSATSTASGSQPETLLEVPGPEGRTTLLKRDALGLPALFFCIATAAAPLTGLDRLGRRAGVDGLERARRFPGESAGFRLARLEAAGLPPRALKRLRGLLVR